jgi:hypothetical protein
MPQGVRSTTEAYSEGIVIRMVGDRIAELQPDVAPLVVMSIKSKRKFRTHSPKIEKLEDDLRNLWIYHNASDISDTDTALLVNDGTLVAIGDLLAPQNTITSTAAEEVLRVTGIATNTLTVVRNIGAAGADTISASQSLRIIGSAYAEGATLAVPRTTTKTTVVSYTQIFKEPVQITETMRSTLTYGADEEDHHMKHAMMEYRRQIEAAGLWGRPSEALGPPAVRTTMGFKAAVATNVTDMSTTITLRKMNTFASTAFRFGAPTKLLIAAPIYMEAFNFFSENKLLTSVGQKIFGVQIQTLLLAHGKLLLARNWALENGISGESGYNDEAYSVDLANVELRYLVAHGRSRDTAVRRDVVKDGADAQTHEIKGELGWVFGLEKTHARIVNSSDYA